MEELSQEHAHQKKEFKALKKKELELQLRNLNSNALPVGPVVAALDGTSNSPIEQPLFRVSPRTVMPSESGSQAATTPIPSQPLHDLPESLVMPRTQASHEMVTPISNLQLHLDELDSNSDSNTDDDSESPTSEKLHCSCIQRS